MADVFAGVDCLGHRTDASGFDEVFFWLTFNIFHELVKRFSANDTFLGFKLVSQSMHEGS